MAHRGEDLYEQHAQGVYRYLFSLGADADTAEDLTQEVFLTLLDKQAQVKHHPNPAGWLWKTLQYKLGHAFSRQAVRAKYEAGEADPDWLPAPLPATGGTLDEILPRQLPERDRQLLKMAYEEGLTYEEISRRLGIPPATCGTWLYRARQRCKHYLTLSEGGNPVEKT